MGRNRSIENGSAKGQSDWISTVPDDDNENDGAQEKVTGLPDELRPLLKHYIEDRKTTMRKLLRTKRKEDRVDVSSMIKNPLSATREKIDRLIIRLRIVHTPHIAHVRSVFDDEKRALLRKKKRNDLGTEVALFLSDFPDINEETGKKPNASQLQVCHSLRLTPDKLRHLIERADCGDPFPFEEQSPVQNWRLIRGLLASFEESEASYQYIRLARSKKRREVVIGNAWLHQYIRKTYEAEDPTEHMLLRDKVFQEFLTLGYDYTDEIDRGLNRNYPRSITQAIVSAVLEKRPIADAIEKTADELMSRDKELRGTRTGYRTEISENDLAPVRKPSRRQ